jgi:uncharacterized protein with PIN domain
MTKRGYRFAVDASLGRLARHLRLMGFDAAYQGSGEAVLFFNRTDRDRIALIRIKRLQGRLPQRVWLFIHPNDPEAQVRSVLEALNIHPEDLCPFSRCILCNRPVVPLAKDGLRGRVPEYVWQTQSHFSGCPQCGRVFWPGSHTQRYRQKINHWFKEIYINSYET